MVLSMTGYGRANAAAEGKDITVEIKSVNSRYFEYSSRMPRSCAAFDDRLKKLVNEAVSRGKAELSLTVQQLSGADTTISVNEGVAAAYCAAMHDMAAAYKAGKLDPTFA